MKNFLITASFLLFNFVTSAAPAFTENFDSYTDGPLVGQGPWVQLGASVVNPIQVASGVVTVRTSGQDVNAPLGNNINAVDGTTFYYGFSLHVTNAGTGDFGVHMSPSSGSTVFNARLYTQAANGGYVLGYLETSGTGTPVNYGSTVLNLNTTYNITVAYDFVAGPLNNTARVYVDPTSVIENENTPYLSDAWTVATAEPTVFGAFNLRQGSGADASPAFRIDNIAVSTLFADVAQVPEPSSYVLLGLGGLVFALRRRFARN